MNLSPEDKLSVRIKAARLRLEQQYGTQKISFVASPNTTEQVQQNAQQTGQQPNQGSPSQAVTPSGVTLDEVVQMLDQFYSETISGIQQIQTLVTQVQTMMPTGGSGGGKGDSQNFKSMNERLMKIEQMVAGGAGGTASPADQAAAQGPPLPAAGEGNAQGAGQAPPGQAPIGGGPLPAPMAPQQ